MAAVPRLQARSVAADATQVRVDVDRGDVPNALRQALLPSDPLEQCQGLPVGGDSVRGLALHLAPQEVEADQARQILLLFDCRLGRHLCVTWCNVPRVRIWTLSWANKSSRHGANLADIGKESTYWRARRTIRAAAAKEAQPPGLGGPGGWFGPGPEASTPCCPQWSARRPSR